MILRSMALLTIAIFTTSCESSDPSGGFGNPGAAGQTRVSFSQIEGQILGPKCVSCHQSPNGREGVNLDSFAAIQAAPQTHGHSIVEPGNPKASHLADMVESGDMPPGGPRLSEAEIDAISTWIAQGALNN